MKNLRCLGGVCSGKKMCGTLNERSRVCDNSVKRGGTSALVFEGQKGKLKGKLVSLSLLEALPLSIAWSLH